MGERLTDGLAALQATNPWLAVFGDDPVAIAARIRRDDVAWRQAAAAARAARLAAGGTGWNAWALEHLGRKGVAVGSPALQDIWAAIARLDIEEGAAGRVDDYAAWLFPGDVVLPARRRGAVALDHAAIMGDLRGETCIVEAEITLERAHIRGDCVLRGATLHQALRAYQVRIEGALDVTGAKLKGDLWLRGGSEIGALRAADAVFEGEAGFGQAKFAGAVDARSATFAANAGFDEAAFAAAVDMSGARFAKAADFTHARFATAPVFDRARFAGALRLDGATFPTQQAQVELTALAALIARNAGQA